MSLGFTVRRSLRQPQPLLRLELIRFLAPLAILGFMSGRLMHADALLGDSGFHVPDLGGNDWRQPLFLPQLPNGVAWAIALATVATGLSLSLGFRTRIAALGFALLMAFIALDDRLAAFTVTKLAPTVALALFFSPAGARYGIDAFLAQRDSSDARPAFVSSGALPFFQVLLPVFYCASGLCKARGDWLSKPHVLWTLVHDSYQTRLSWEIVRMTPLWGWNVLQSLVLALELFAPLWLGWRRSRPVALCLFVGMHVMIGLMFGPVKWFALLMIALLIGSYLPEDLLTRLAERLAAAGL